MGVNPHAPHGTALRGANAPEIPYLSIAFLARAADRHLLAAEWNLRVPLNSLTADRDARSRGSGAGRARRPFGFLASVKGAKAAHLSARSPKKLGRGCGKRLGRILKMLLMAVRIGGESDRPRRPAFLYGQRASAACR